MLVVLPICPRDAALACLNLQLALKLDPGGVPFSALISAPTGCDTAALEALARKYFASVGTHHYSEWTGDRSWPRPQNWAWQSTARHLATLALPPKCWFWWEADATPLRAQWLAALLDAYAAGARPFAGQHIGVDAHGVHRTTGVALYPADVRPYAPAAFITRATPFDCALFTAVGEHQITSLAHLIGNYLKPAGRPGHSIASVEEAHALASQYALYHGSSDGSLARILLSERRPLARLAHAARSLITAAPSSAITVVITNFQRPDKLWSAFQSCEAARVANIIVSSSGASSDVLATHKRIRRQNRRVRITSIAGDEGCNEMWLRGARLVRTPWTHLLHDDDLLLPAFATLEPFLHGHAAGFYHWNAARHGTTTAPPGSVFPKRPSGAYHTDDFWPSLLGPGNYAISPVTALFPTEHVTATLEECERAFTQARYHIRPTMMVGNDLLLWLRAVDRYPSFGFLSTPLISFGHWEGSATFDDYYNKRGRLSPCYDATRSYYLHGPEPAIRASRPLVHLVTAFGCGTPHVDFATRAWRTEYDRGNWTRCDIADDALPRLFADTKRRVPYLKDMIEHGLASTREDAIFVFTNSDVIPTDRLTWLLLDAFTRHRALCSYRRDSRQSGLLTPSQIRTTTLPYCGLDLFAFTRSWWLEHRDALPDLLFATEAWDYALQALMRSTGSPCHQYLIYHAMHPSVALTTAAHASTAHNRALCEPFLRGHNTLVYWKMEQKEALRALMPR